MDKWKAFKPPQKLLVVAALVLIVLGLIYAVAIAPLIKKIDTLNKQITAQEVKLIKTSRLINSKEEIEGEYDKVKSYFTLQGSDEEIISMLLKETENCAGKAEVTLLQVSPEGKPEAMENYKTYGINIIFEAPMEKIFDFLYQIKNSAVLFDIARINISPRDKLNMVMKVKLKIKGIALL
jgi:hypothetical protein